MVNWEIFKPKAVSKTYRIYFGKTRGMWYILPNNAFIREMKQRGYKCYEIGLDEETGVLAFKLTENELGTYVIRYGEIVNGKQIAEYLIEHIGEPADEYELEYDSENDYYYCTIEKTVTPDSPPDSTDEPTTEPTEPTTEPTEGNGGNP